jgi:hypothetical protein
MSRLLVTGRKERKQFDQVLSVADSTVTATVMVRGNLLYTKVLTLVSRQLSQAVQSPNYMQCRPAAYASYLNRIELQLIRNIYTYLLYTHPTRRGHDSDSDSDSFLFNSPAMDSDSNSRLRDLRTQTQIIYLQFDWTYCLLLAPMSTGGAVP